MKRVTILVAFLLSAMLLSGCRFALLGQTTPTDAPTPTDIETPGDIVAPPSQTASKEFLCDGISMRGILFSDLAVLHEKIDMEKTCVVNCFGMNGDNKPPALSMDKASLFWILEKILSYDWVPTSDMSSNKPYRSSTVLEGKGFYLAIVCENTIIDRITFLRDADGNPYVWSENGKKDAYLSEEDYQAIYALVSAAPLWTETK